MLIEFSKPKFISFSSALGSMARPLSYFKPVILNLGYRITTLDVCRVEERESWLEWREVHKTVPTSSILSSYFGHFYESWEKTMKSKIFKDDEENTKKTSKYSSLFAQKAINHGTVMEAKAKECFKEFLMSGYCVDAGFFELNNGEESTLSLVKHGIRYAEIISTPDSIFNVNGETMIVEYKCPYYCVVRRKDKTVRLVAENHLKLNPFGKEHAFIQAACYCLLNGGDSFTTVFYYTDTVDEEFIVIYRYKPMQELFDILFEAIIETQTKLEELNEGKMKKSEKLKISSQKKKQITQYMTETLCETFIYDNTSKKIQMNSPPIIAPITGNINQGTQVVAEDPALENGANSLGTYLSPVLLDNFK